jgi:moderate conductance mechanosensitive channel
MKQRFQHNGIEVASATQTILMHIAPPADNAAHLTPRRAAG